MSQFSFIPADEEAEQFCWEIVRHLMAMGKGLSRSEALQRINEFWKGLTIGDKNNGGYVLYHKDAGYWAWVIFNGGK